MENASKALIIVGSVLLTVMIIAIAVYIFANGQSFTVSVVSTTDDTVVASFNANFAAYETAASYTFDDDSRLVASTQLNTISDVVSCVNFAFTVNDENNNSYQYETSYGLETENAVEVYIDMGTHYSDYGLDYQYYLIEPNADVESEYVYGFDSLESTRTSRLSSTKNGFTRGNAVSCNKLLELLNISKLIESSNKKYTIYKYYFLGTLELDETTSKVNSVKFELVVDDEFDNIT